MKTTFKRNIVIKVLSLFLIPLLLTSCALRYKHIDGATDFNSIIKNLVDESYEKIGKNLAKDDVVLVSDFVNLDYLKNYSKLGFLLSASLKDSLSSKNIIVREIELGKDFKIGKHGFNLLSRKSNEIYNEVENERFAVVGTYTVTTKRLIIFIKLLDIRTGAILASSTTSAFIDDEILELEKVPKEKTRAIYAPVVL